MTTPLQGRPIAITGASSGIGLATAVACARAGMPVALAARRLDRLEELAERIRAEGGKAIVVPVDVAVPEECARLVARTLDAFGSIHAVFANAGYGMEGPTQSMSLADIRAMFETNFWGTLHTIRPAIDAMLAAGKGHVLICASCLSKVGVPFHASYSATKAAQDHFGRALRVELAPRGVFVSTVHPIATATEFSELTRVRSGGRRSSPQPPDRMIQTPERVAEAIVRCLRRPRGEVWTSTSVRLGMALATAMPGLTDWALRRKMRRRLAELPAPPVAPTSSRQ